MAHLPSAEQLISCDSASPLRALDDECFVAIAIARRAVSQTQK